MHKRREFGEQLRRQRERRGVSLAKISDQTKLAPSIFAALEKGDCSRWPGGVYNRAYVRAYAAAVGLDAEETLSAFLQCFGDGDAAGDAPVAVGTTPGELRRPPAPLRLRLAPDPLAGRRLLARRARAAFCELAVVAIAAGALNLATAADLAVSVAAVLLTLHAVERLSGKPIDRLLMRPARPAPAPSPVTEDVPDADPAHSAA